MSPRAFILIALAIAFFVLPSTTTYLGRLAVVWRSRLPAGFPDVAVRRAAVGLVSFVVALAWLAGHLRHALNTASGAPASFTTREGFTIVLPTRDQLRPLAMLAAAAAAASRRTLRRVRVADGADVVVRHAVYRERSHPRQKRRLLRLHAAAPRTCARASVSVSSCWRPRVRRGLRVRRRARADPVRPAHVAERAPARRCARRGLLSAAGARRLARRACASSSRRPASSRARATPTCTRGCRRRSRWRSRRWSARCSVCCTPSGAPNADWSPAVALYALVLVGGTAYATFIQRFVVAPNEQARETPYILHNIEATRAGIRARPDRGARAHRRCAAHARRHRPQSRRRSTTSASGITSRCSRRSGRSRRSAPTTT